MPPVDDAVSLLEDVATDDGAATLEDGMGALLADSAAPEEDTGALAEDAAALDDGVGMLTEEAMALEEAVGPDDAVAHWHVPSNCP